MQFSAKNLQNNPPRENPESATTLKTGVVKFTLVFCENLELSGLVCLRVFSQNNLTFSLQPQEYSFETLIQEFSSYYVNNMHSVK